MTPPVTDLVLLGGGHAHLSVLKRFGMRPQPGLRITLVSEGSSAPYSGMLPGLIAGHYTPEEMHVDLHALARFAGARFVDATVTGIDLEGRRLRFADRPPLAFDLLSINAGITPALPARLRDGAGLTPVKPIARFYPRWQALLARVQDATRPLRIAVVGGGAGGLERALAVDYRLRQLRDAAGQPRRVQLALYTASERLLPGRRNLSVLLPKKPRQRVLLLLLLQKRQRLTASQRSKRRRRPRLPSRQLRGSNLWRVRNNDAACWSKR